MARKVKKRGRGTTRISSKNQVTIPAEALRAAGLRPGDVLVLFGPRPLVTGWLCVESGRPPERLLPLVRHFA